MTKKLLAVLCGHYHPAMKIDPLDAALRSVAETKQLLETLITSSESFDYPKAKVALRDLQRKIRELGKLKSDLEASRNLQSNVCVVQFVAHRQAAQNQ